MTATRPDQPFIGPDVRLDAPAWIDPTVRLFGDVRVGRGASLWNHVVCRAESEYIEIGPYTNIQDFVMIHFGGSSPSRIGAWCSITHHVTVHGATIGDHTLVGINATVMDGAVVGANCIIGGHAIVTEGTRIPDNSIVLGAPARAVRPADARVANKLNAWMYWRNGLAYAAADYRLWGREDFRAEIAAVREQFEAEGEAGADAGPAT